MDRGGDGCRRRSADLRGCGAIDSLACAAAPTAATVTVPAKSAPESITIAPNGDSILGSTGSAKIYRAEKGCGKGPVFIDASAEGAVYFLGVLADARPAPCGPAIIFNKLYRVPMDGYFNPNTYSTRSALMATYWRPSML
jgi:hypothetical protein